AGINSNSEGVDPIIDMLPVVDAFAWSTNAKLANEVNTIRTTTETLENL
ncbi:MAG TPA: hypothetical protein HA327_00405, partial [Candidatus Poseidoniaceae archaeon]|nr:hypothetical protein [Candidatus Poseidoniaceae archaeon]